MGPLMGTPFRPDAPWAAGWGPLTNPAFPLTRAPRLPGVSSLWTPEGERPIRRGSSTPPPSGPGPAAAGPDGGSRPDGGAGPGPDEGGLSEQEQAALTAQMEEVRRQLLQTPAAVVVANHAYGLFELAAIHLSEQPPHLEEARLAVDGLGVLVEGLAGRLGEAEQPLKDALAQIRLAFVQISGAADAGTGGSGSTGGSGGSGGTEGSAGTDG